MWLLLSFPNAAAIPMCVCVFLQLSVAYLSISDFPSSHSTAYFYLAEVELSSCDKSFSPSFFQTSWLVWIVGTTANFFFHTPVKIQLKLGHCLTKRPLLREACLYACICILCAWLHASVFMICVREDKDRLFLHVWEKVWYVLQCKKSKSVAANSWYRMMQHVYQGVEK